MTSTVPGTPETVFTYGAPQLKFGNGASDEIGYDLSRYGVKRVLVVTDPGVAATGHPQRVADQIAGIQSSSKAVGEGIRTTGEIIGRLDEVQNRIGEVLGEQERMAQLIEAAG